MARVIDARGLSCPQPVILVREAIQEGVFPIEVLVETATSRDNVRRVAEREKLNVSVEQEEEEFKLIIR